MTLESGTPHYQLPTGLLGAILRLRKRSSQGPLPGPEGPPCGESCLCFVPGIWGCLHKVVVNTGHNSSLHRALYFRKMSISSRTNVTSLLAPSSPGDVPSAIFLEIVERLLRAVCHSSHPDDSFWVATNNVQMHSCINCANFIFQGAEWSLALRSKC